MIELEDAALARREPTPGLVLTTNRRFQRGDPKTTGRLVSALAALIEPHEGAPRTSFLQDLPVAE